MSGIDEHLSEREEIEMLLPWYVTGKLDAADTARVEAYLAQHPDMLHQLAIIAEEQTITVEDNEAIRPRLASPGAIVARTQAPGSAMRAWFGGVVESVKGLFQAPTPSAASRRRSRDRGDRAWCDRRCR